MGLATSRSEKILEHLRGLEAISYRKVNAFSDSVWPSDPPLLEKNECFLVTRDSDQRASSEQKT